MSLYVQQLWRYPVKSMAGEALETAELRADGIAGDRLVVVHGPNGLVTSRTRPQLLALHATLSPKGEPYVEHLPASSEAVAGLVAIAAGPSGATAAGCGRTSSSAASKAWRSATGRAGGCASATPSSGWSRCAGVAS